MFRYREVKIVRGHVGLQLGSEVVIRLVGSQRTGLGNEVSDDLSHLNSRPCTLHQCRAHSPYQVQCSCRCCRPLRSPRPLTSGTSITGMATASCPAIISRPTTAFQFMVRRDQSAALQAMRQATGIMAGGTISTILGFSMDATTAAVSARAGLGRPSGGCGIVGRSAQKVRLVRATSVYPSISDIMLQHRERRNGPTADIEDSLGRQVTARASDSGDPPQTGQRVFAA